MVQYALGVLMIEFVMAVIAGAAPSPALALVGPTEADPWGVSAKTADKLVVRRLLFERKYDQLGALLDGYQAAVEQDCKRELLAFDAFEAFSSADPALEPLLDEFVAKRPGYAARVARGQYLTATALARRGRAWIQDTSASQLRGMNQAADQARVDLAAANKAHPTMVAYRLLVDLDTFQGEPASSKAAHVEKGLKLCPSSFQLYVKWVGMSVPRWGGSYEAMLALAARAPVKSNPHLATLTGNPAADRCSLARDSRDYETALTECNAALEHGPHWEFLYERAQVLIAMGRYEKALEDVEAALLQRPQKPRVVAARANALARLNRWREAHDAMALLEKLDPYDTNYVWLVRKFAEACDGGIKEACRAAVK